MSATSPAERLKKVMRIALVGIRPADQVMLKGYLRLLLRLEADLEWVSANNPQIDLFLVNQEFEHADSVQRLLASNRSSATLFVNRKDDGDGQMSGNVLTLPLKELEPLNIWLFQNISFLQNHHTPNVTPTQQNKPTHDHRQTLDEIIAKKTNQNHANSEATNAPPSHTATPSLMAIVNFMTQLQKREDQLFTLTDHQGNILAYIQPKRQLVWAVHTNINLSHQWQLKSTASTPKITENPSMDLVQWLWELGWQSSNLLTSLIDVNTPYRLSYWVKPESHQNRHEVLKIQCVLEARAVTVQELVQISQIEQNMVVRCLASLLISGVFVPSVYDSLANYTPMNQNHSVNHQAVKPTSQPMPAQSPPKAVTNNPPPNHVQPSTPPQTAKPEVTQNEGGMMGFLSKLRRKLGL